jgi:hypothetical protein
MEVGYADFPKWENGPGEFVANLFVSMVNDMAAHVHPTFA